MKYSKKTKHEIKRYLELIGAEIRTTLYSKQKYINTTDKKS